MSIEGELRHEDLLWLLGSLCGLSRIPFDAALIAQDFPPPYTLITLHEAARALGIKTGPCPVANLDWQKLPLPAIAFQKNVSPDSVEPSTSEIALLEGPAPDPTAPCASAARRSR